MGVESYCVKFYLVRDLWWASRWRREEMGVRQLDHGGVRAYVAGTVSQGASLACPKGVCCIRSALWVPRNQQETAGYCRLLQAPQVQVSELFGLCLSGL